MRTWTRAAQQTICGGPCRRFIAKGQPMLELRSPSWTKGKVRCVDCAGEPVPVNIPPLPARKAIEPTAIVRAGTAALPFGRFETLADFKMAAAGVDREPGEDDE